MGGTLAMMVAARYPERVGKVMVVDMLPQPAGLFGGSAADMGPLADSLMSSASGRRLISSLMSAFSPPNASNRLSDPDVVARAMHDLAGMDLGPQLPRQRVPLTVLNASPDPRMQTAIDRQFADAYARARGARLVRVERSGHMVMLDQPARFQAELRNFLRA
jgi:pimeloyl-ACP methyl ester carboxylesterase